MDRNRYDFCGLYPKAFYKNQEKAKPVVKRGRKATGLIGAVATDLIVRKPSCLEW